MSRCIDADAFYKDICDSLNEMTRIGIAVDGEWLWGKLNDSLENAPAIEPRCEECEAFNKTRLLIPQPERKKGHWIRHPEQRNIFNGKTIECSECHEKYTVQYVEDELFCRHCGADMTEGES